MPHPINTWLVDIEGKPIKRDLYDTHIWRRLQWGVFNPEVILIVVFIFPLVNS